MEGIRPIEKPRILVCIPAYNEASSIADIIKRASNYASEVVVYDDGSSDTTAEIADAAGASVIRNSKNKGYGVAIRRLFEVAAEKNADVMVTLDSDGQHNPDEIPRVVAPILDGKADLVIGSRFIHDGNSPQVQQNKIPTYRNLGIKTITRLTQSASYKQISDAQSGFRAYGKYAISSINLFEDGMAVSSEIILRAREKNLQIKEVPVSVDYDIQDRSTHNPLSHGVGVLYSIIQFISLRHPLAFYGLPGIILLITAVAFLNYGMMVYGSYRHSSIEYIVSAIGFGVIGVVLLSTGAILYTITALLKGRIREL
jgi:glycosyltransferase involved in cell wall biosynthesis